MKKPKTFTVLAMIVLLIAITIIVLVLKNKTTNQQNKNVCSDYTIKDNNDPLAQEARAALLSIANISQDYLDKHFTFLCGKVDHPKRTNYPAKYVFYNYTIGEYTSTFLLYNTSNANLVSGNVQSLKGLNESEQILSKSVALQKLKICLTNKPHNVTITLQHPINNSTKTKFLMWGETRNKYAQIDMITGSCESEYKRKK